MGSKSDWLENQLLNGALPGPNFTRATSLWLALYTAMPTDTGGGTEVTGGSYARVQFSNSTNTWTKASAGTNGAVENKAEITFAQATASWGTIVGWAMWTTSNSGNMYYWGSLTTTKAVNSGDTAKFATGDLDISEA